ARVNNPPTYTVLLLTARQYTTSSTDGLHAVAVSVAASIAARLFRCFRWCRTVSPTVLKKPPAYTTPPLTASAYTEPSVLGSHALARPVAASTAARFWRGSASWIALKLPPRYTVEPLTATAYTLPATFGCHGVTAPVDASTAAMLARAESPTVVNPPAMYTVETLT